MVVERPNQVWCADTTYIPMRRGFLYLVAVMDWATRKVLSWRLSNTMEADFCIEALQEALARYGAPEIFTPNRGARADSSGRRNTFVGDGCDGCSEATLGAIWTGFTAVPWSTAGGEAP